MKILKVFGVAFAALFLALAIAAAQIPGFFTNGALLIGKGNGNGIGTLSTTRKGDVPCYSGSIWSVLAGNNSGTKFMSEDGSGNCAWASSPSAPAAPPQGRLTLTNGTPLMKVSVLATSSVYYNIYAGNEAWVWTGSVDDQLTIPTAGLTDTMPTSGTGVTNSGANIDFWLIESASALVLVHTTNGSGGGWASDTGSPSAVARGTGYSQLDYTTRPYITNAVALTHAYNGSTDYGTIAVNRATHVGSSYMTAAGQTGMNINPGATSGGGAPILGLYNAYNRERMCTTSLNSHSSWTTTAAAWEVEDIGGTGSGLNNRVSWIDGLAQSTVEAEHLILTAENSGTGFVSNGIKFNATTGTPDGQQGVMSGSSTSNSNMNVSKASMTGFGLNFAQAMQKSSNGKWFGTGDGQNEMLKVCLNM